MTHEITQSAADLPSIEKILLGILFVLTAISIITIAFRAIRWKNDTYDTRWEYALGLDLALFPILWGGVLAVYAIWGLVELGILIARHWL